jgi:DNA mismatch repair protein MSH4
MQLDSDQRHYLRFKWQEVEQEIKRGRPSSSTGSDVVPTRLSIAGVEIINGCRKKTHYQFQTLDLLVHSTVVQTQADIVTAQSDRVIVWMKSQLLKHVGRLLNVSDAIGNFDMVCSFTQLSTSQRYTRPEIRTSLVLRGARHPVMEIRKPDFVANDIYSGNQNGRCIVITGSNMSGKSTYIKSVALIQILAQMGCFVPADFAAISVCDALYTRMSTEDKPQSNLGTFAVEMQEMNMILRYAWAC